MQLPGKRPHKFVHICCYLWKSFKPRGCKVISFSCMQGGLWAWKGLIQKADVHTLGVRWHFYYERIMQVRIVGWKNVQIFLPFSINIVYNGTTPGAESPFHACQGCCDPVPPHSTSLLTFCRPDSVTIVNTCCKGIMTAVSPLSWQSWSQRSSGTLLPWLFNQPASLLKPSYGWLRSYFHSSVILRSRLRHSMWQTNSGTDEDMVKARVTRPLFPLKTVLQSRPLNGVIP